MQPRHPSLFLLASGLPCFGIVIAAMFLHLGGNWFWFVVSLITALTSLLFGFSLGKEKYARRGVYLFFGLLSLAFFFLTLPWMDWSWLWLVFGAFLVSAFGYCDWLGTRSRPKSAQHYERGYRSIEHTSEIMPESQEQEQYIYPQASYLQEAPMQQQH